MGSATPPHELTGSSGRLSSPQVNQKGKPMSDHFDNKQEYDRGVPQTPIRLSRDLYVTHSWRKVGVTYRQDLVKRTCDCWACSNPKSKTYGQPCKHLENAYTASFFENLERATRADTAVLERLLASGHYDDRPDIRGAIAAALWERRLREENPPPPAESKEAIPEMEEELAA